MKNRLLYFDLKKYIDDDHILLISGIRQAGKTTLMRQIFEETNRPKLWFDLDNPLDQLFFENQDPKNIYNKIFDLTGQSVQRIYVFIDEIQNYPGIFDIMKFLTEQFPIKFIVSCSVNIFRGNSFQELLNGKVLIFSLKPMNFREFLYFKEKEDYTDILNKSISDCFKFRNISEFKKYENLYDNYIYSGGFPEVVTAGDNETKIPVLRNIFVSFFDKDIRFPRNIKDIHELRDLILLLASRVGTMLDITRLANELGVNRYKIYDYLQILEDKFLIKLLPKFSTLTSRAISGGKKVYFIDTGLLSMLGKTTDNQLFENTVVNQLSVYGDLKIFDSRNTIDANILLDEHIAFDIKQLGTDIQFERFSGSCRRLGIKEYYMISRQYVENSGYIYPMFI